MHLFCLDAYHHEFVHGFFWRPHVFRECFDSVSNDYLNCLLHGNAQDGCPIYVFFEEFCVGRCAPESGAE